MLKPVVALAVAAGAAAALYHAPRVGVQAGGTFLLPTGQGLTPAGVHLEVSDRPLGMVRSPGGNLLAVTTGSNFAPRSLHLIDIAAQKTIQSIPIGDSFVGVAFDAAGEKLYVGGGND